MGARKYFIGEGYAFGRSRTARAARFPLHGSRTDRGERVRAEAPTAQGMNGKQPQTAKFYPTSAAKAQALPENTHRGQKTQHARNLAHCGALEREGNRAKEPSNAHRPPKTPQDARKASRTSKHTPEEPTAPHGQKIRPSRQTRRGRANAKPQRTTDNESRHALPTTPTEAQRAAHLAFFAPRRAIYCKY